MWMWMNPNVRHLYSGKFLSTLSLYDQSNVSPKKRPFQLFSRRLKHLTYGLSNVSPKKRPLQLFPSRLKHLIYCLFTQRNVIRFQCYPLHYWIGICFQNDPERRLETVISIYMIKRGTLALHRLFHPMLRWQRPNCPADSSFQRFSSRFGWYFHTDNSEHWLGWAIQRTSDEIKCHEQWLHLLHSHSWIPSRRRRDRHCSCRHKWIHPTWWFLH